MMKTLLIPGVRRKIKQDTDARHTAVFTCYLLAYLQIFAFLGVICPVLIAVDYFIERNISSETVINKQQKTWYNKATDYYLYLTDKTITVNRLAYEQIRMNDAVNLHHTVIFKTLTDITFRKGAEVYISRPFGIYRWPLCFAVLSFIFSAFLLLKNTPASKVNRDILISAGLLNFFTCVFMFAVLISPTY
ncbi:MAG: hypothetical protein LBF89_09310 [Bacteroidales bacterium]|jgi:hypothetical protein|nr:hypothetical protein [Bacteroidales bacterium]